MTTEINSSGSSSTMPMPAQSPETYRPDPPDSGPGRWFRACAGIKEDVMDWTPSERAKYSGLGIIVLNTGLLAAFAMFTALDKIVSAPAIALIPIALIWGWIIFSVDRWLITSTHGVSGVNRVLVFIPRLVLAVLIAFTIAEPLTLRIFQNTLNSTVATTRTTNLQNYESKLQICNPVSGAWVTSSACSGFHLTVENSPYATQQKLAQAKQQQAQLQSTVNAEQAHERNLVATEQGECAGTAGAGMSGHAGDGPLCRQDRSIANSYDQRSGLAAQESQLNKLRTSINNLNQAAGSAQATYSVQLHAAITKAVSEKRKDLGQIGILDEWQALEKLSSQSSFVFFGHWLLVLVLIALDCLPILAKLMGGTSGYDRLLAQQRASDERIYDFDLRFREETATVETEVGIYLTEMSKRDRMRRLGQEERVRGVQGETDGLDDVRNLAARWLAEAGL